MQYLIDCNMAGMYKNLKEIKFRLETKGKKGKEILKKNN